MNFFLADSGKTFADDRDRQPKFLTKKGPSCSVENMPCRRFLGAILSALRQCSGQAMRKRAVEGSLCKKSNEILRRALPKGRACSG